MLKTNLVTEIKSFIIAFFGFLILALTVNLISWKYQLVSGGFPGFGLFISYLTGFPVGNILLILNLVILALVFLFTGPKFGLKSAIGYILFPLLINFTKTLFNLGQSTTPPFLTSAMFMTIQAFIAGIAVTLFFSQSYSAGGWGALAFVIKKRFNLTGPQFLLIMDILLSFLTSIFLNLSKGILLGINSFVFYYSFKYSLKLFENKQDVGK